MRLCQRNKQNLKYALYAEKSTVYLTDDDGNIVYQDVDGDLIPVETGNRPPHFDKPVDFKGYIQFSGGESEARAFGVSVDSYSHILVMKRDELPIDETSLIFQDSEPQYDSDGYLVEKSADYRVYRVAPSLNFVTYLLRSIDK